MPRAHALAVVPTSLWLVPAAVVPPVPPLVSLVWGKVTVVVAAAVAQLVLMAREVVAVQVAVQVVSKTGAYAWHIALATLGVWCGSSYSSFSSTFSGAVTVEALALAMAMALVLVLQLL